MAPLRPSSRKRLLIWLCWVLAALFVAVLAIAPVRAWHALRQAQSALERRDFDDALRWLRSAEERAPSNGEVLFCLARVHRRKSDFRKMESYLAAAERVGYPQRPIQRERWLAMAQSGQLSEVGAYLPELLNNPEGDAREICEAYVNGFCINLQFDLANSLIDAWQADFPADAETHIRRGFIHQTMREWSSAVEEYRRGLERQPGRADVRLRMGQCLLEMGAADEAAREFRASANTDPGSSTARMGLAKALVELKQYDEAEAILQSLLAKETCRVEARRGLGRISLLRKQPEQAANWLEPLVDEWPYDASARYLLAQAYRETGQFDRAQAHFRALREFEEPLRRLKELYDLVPANPEDIDLRFELGKLLLQYESREEGAAYLQSVLRLAPEHREAHELLADYYSRSGDRRLASVHRRLAHAQSSAPDGT